MNWEILLCKDCYKTPKMEYSLLRVLLVIGVFANYASYPVVAFTPNLVQQLTTDYQGPYVQVEPAAVSKECEAAFMKLTTTPDTLVQVVDAIGKPAAGFLEGNLAWIGHYDQCASIVDFQYCTVQMQLNGSSVIPELVLPVAWGVCVPKECNTSDVTNAIDLIADLVNISQYIQTSDVKGAATVCAKNPPRPYDAAFILTVLLCSLIIVVAVGGALFQAAPKVKCQSLTSPAMSLVEDDLIDDAVDDEDEPLLDIKDGRQMYGVIQTKLPTEKQNIVVRFIRCFSLTDNLSKLLNTNQSDRSIKCLNGIRVISMTWVILGHTFIFTLNVGAQDNPRTAISYLDRFGFQAVCNAFFSVDTFFFLSGFLLSYLTLSRMTKTNGKIPWFWFYFHRFWRLTPVYMFVMLFFMYLAPYMGSGPLWQFVVPRPNCPKYWWTNFLYINNFWPKNFTDECIAWSWYLANDMQFFAISPIFLISLFMFPAFGLVLVFGALAASFIVTGSLIGYYDFAVAINFNGAEGAGGVVGAQPPLDYFSVVYAKPYCRIAPYLVGILLGYAFYKIGERKIRMNPTAVALGWALASAMGISCVYGFYPSYDSGNAMSTAANVIYGTFSRCVWAIALSWVVFACKHGYGGWVNDFLSWNGWVVLSRLTYTGYLIHPIVINTFYFNFAAPIHYSIILLAFYFVGVLGIAYGMAALLSLAIEYPFANMEKLFMPKTVQGKRTIEKRTEKNGSVATGQES